MNKTTDTHINVRCDKESMSWRTTQIWKVNLYVLMTDECHYAFEAVCLQASHFSET